MIRAVIADDQALVRGGFRMILDAQHDIEVVGEAADGREAVALARAKRPDVLLMDIRMPNFDGLQATAEVTRLGLPCHVVILTTFDLDEYVYEGLRAGACGFLLKDVDPAELVHAVRVAAKGDALLAPTVTRRLVERFISTAPHSSGPSVAEMLTDRERDVLLRIARGCSNAEVAAALFVSEATVKTHVTRLLAKLGVRDRVQAVILAYETGLVRAGSS